MKASWFDLTASTPSKKCIGFWSLMSISFFYPVTLKFSPIVKETHFWKPKKHKNNYRVHLHRFHYL